MDSLVTSSIKQKRLTRSQLRQRARKIKLALTDVDGVLTDTGIYYSVNGEELYRFSRRDGMGVDVLRKAGIETAIITSENSQIVRRRGEKLLVQYLFLGIKDKLAYLPEIMKASGLTIDQLAYIGDDVNDLGIMQEINRFGLTGAPCDALPVIIHSSHYHSKIDGGYGAFRDFAEWILQLRGNQ